MFAREKTLKSPNKISGKRRKLLVEEMHHLLGLLLEKLESERDKPRGATPSVFFTEEELKKFTHLAGHFYYGDLMQEVLFRHPDNFETILECQPLYETEQRWRGLADFLDAETRGRCNISQMRNSALAEVNRGKSLMKIDPDNIYDARKFLQYTLVGTITSLSIIAGRNFEGREPAFGAKLNPEQLRALAECLEAERA